MLVTAHDAFMVMYYALEAATDEYPDQGLTTLVQDCDPFVWKDRLSADPAVWTEFSGGVLQAPRRRTDDGRGSPRLLPWLAR